ncbi:MAG: 4'-phosphopantetheinyl transferase superfamily protein [Bacteroidota bacterium]
MIAIDLIDLYDPLLKNRDTSLRFITHPNDSNNLNFWPLWAAKEAAFKLQRTKQPFRPKTINIQFDSENTFQYHGLKGNIYQSEDWVISTLGDQKIEYVTFDVETDDPSTEIRKKIKEWFFENHQINTFVSSDKSGLPILNHNQSPISITHHGRFMAFAYLPE